MPPSSNAMSRNQKKTVRKPATKFSHLREKMGKSSLTLYNERFATEKILDKLMNVYHDVTQTNRAKDGLERKAS